MDIPGSANVDYEIIEEEIGNRDRMSVLTLLNSQPSDAGRYVCLATNNVTSSMEAASLNVNGEFEVQVVNECILSYISPTFL